MKEVIKIHPILLFPSSFLHSWKYLNVRKDSGSLAGGAVVGDAMC